MNRTGWRILPRFLVLVAVAGCGGPAGTPFGTPTQPTAAASVPGPATAAPAPSPTAQPGVGGLQLLIGTHVSMATPEGFTRSTSFTGFEHECGASVVVAELPTSYLAMAKELTDANFAKQGITVTSRNDETIDGRAGVMIVGQQKAGGLNFGKILIITGTDTLTVFVTGSFPILGCQVDVGLAMRDASLGLEFDPSLAVDQEAGLVFRLTPTPPLRFAGAVSSGAVYNTSGKLPSADKDEPSLIVALSLGTPAGSDLEAALAGQLKAMATTSDVVIESSESRMVAGLPGAIALASGKRTSTSEPQFIYGALLDEGAIGFVLMVGFCREGLRNEWQDRFAASVESYRRK